MGAFLLKLLQNSMLEIVCKIQEDTEEFKDNDVNNIHKEFSLAEISVENVSSNPTSEDFTPLVGRLYSGCI